MLTSEVPFLGAIPERDTTGEYSGVNTYGAAEGEVDYNLFARFCSGDIDFPTNALKRYLISNHGVMLVTNLLMAKPQFRPSAAQALASPWFLEPPRSRSMSEPQRLQYEMRDLGMGVSLRTVNILTNRNIWSSKSLLNELFPSLATRITDILRCALNKG
jgi:hypothetical protein